MLEHGLPGRTTPRPSSIKSAELLISRLVCEGYDGTARANRSCIKGILGSSPANWSAGRRPRLCECTTGRSDRCWFAHVQDWVQPARSGAAMAGCSSYVFPSRLLLDHAAGQHVELQVPDAAAMLPVPVGESGAGDRRIVRLEKRPNDIAAQRRGAGEQHPGGRGVQAVFACSAPQATARA
jgi:hypothetical protein